MPKRLLLRDRCAETMIAAARSAYPNEFIGVLQGEIGEVEVVVESMIVPPLIDVGEEDASYSPFLLPATVGDIGTFHSHPHGEAMPSEQDIDTSSKVGGVHFILGWPFALKNLKAFDKDGVEVAFSIVP